MPVQLPSPTYLPLPIPKYNYVITGDWGAGIGLVLLVKIDFLYFIRIYFLGTYIKYIIGTKIFYLFFQKIENNGSSNPL